jgi:serine/threonine-protein kinase HipA
MTTEGLSIWLHELCVAHLEQPRGRMRLTYTPEAVQRYGAGTPLLSLSLPVTPDPYPDGVVRTFFDGLLPEGEVRRAIAADLRVAAHDTYTLIAELGRDCAGAVVVLPSGERPPPTVTTLSASAIEAEELARLIDNLRGAPLGIDTRVRVSLAGVQEKLVLTLMPDGRWGRPRDGAPSTHILKPSLTAYPAIVENEAFCLRLAAHLQIAAARVATIAVRGRDVLVVERYDRHVSADGRVERLHQEDICQALGERPETKYEEDGGPSLRRVARLLAPAAGTAALQELLRAVTLNVVLGNGDAHAKNYSLLHGPPGTVRLAPLYDLVSTLVYKQDRLAMYVDKVQRISRVTATHIVNEGVGWGMPRARAAEIVSDVLDRAPAAVEAALAETPGTPSALRATIRRQLTNLSSK